MAATEREAWSIIAMEDFHTPGFAQTPGRKRRLHNLSTARVSGLSGPCGYFCRFSPDLLLTSLHSVGEYLKRAGDRVQRPLTPSLVSGCIIQLSAGMGAQLDHSQINYARRSFPEVPTLCLAASVISSAATYPVDIDDALLSWEFSWHMCCAIHLPPLHLVLASHGTVAIGVYCATSASLPLGFNCNEIPESIYPLSSVTINHVFK